MFSCPLDVVGPVALLRPTGPMRGPEAFDLYLARIWEGLEDPEVRGLVADVRGVTRLPTARDCLRFAQQASAGPDANRIVRSAVVIAQPHPLMYGLLRLVARASRVLTERRVFLNDVGRAIAWVEDAPMYMPHQEAARAELMAE